MSGLGPCRFDGSPAVVRVEMDEGCVCFPDDREQLLCAQHAINSEPLGSFVVVESLGGFEL